MSATTFNQTKNLTSARLITFGVIAGLAGGMVFGMMMAMMGMLPMIAGLVRSQSAFVGFIVHMFISAFIGAVYGLVAGRFPLTRLNAVIGGMLNGVFWWVLGALILMPIGLGMTSMVFHLGTVQWLSLMGHIIYGLVTAFVFIPLARRG
jgi:uncharacterized membrane protein YagU involved in acid resistance